MNLVKELRWRGMIQDIMPGTEEQLERDVTTGYIGFDPTSDSLHIGSLVPILLLMHLQKAGHRPIALVGGATGMIGDPSGKSDERNLLGEDELEKNLNGIKMQLSKFLDFNAAGSNAAIVVNNYDWFRGISFLEFLRDTGKHITVNYMMAKESVKKRIEGETGISYTEFAYQLMQGFDFYYLYKHLNCKLQMGGSDQWGNITTGTELIRRKVNGEAFGFTCPLIRKADGGKFGKTEKGNVWLDPNKTSPYQFYQFWLNASDEDAENWIRIFTFLTQDEVEKLIDDHRQDPGARLLQKALAREVTIFVHSEDEYRKAVETTEKLFANMSAPAESLSVEDIEAMQGVVRQTYDSKLLVEQDLITVLVESKIFPSKGEARKMIQQGGLSVNRHKVSKPAFKIGTEMLLHNKYLLVQKGKKNHYLLEAV
ncbi:MAG: tyrosine--tRNA ligase [Sphingobacteriales bacterium]|nr:MAG: tyrosine--tRNA ligase [Sphingobacteriales bacterium]